VAVYFANSQIFKKDGLENGQSFQLKIASESATYDRKGISVAVFVNFENVTSKLNFQSVGIEV